MSDTNINIGAVRWGYREARAYKQRRRAARIVKIIVGTILLLAVAVLIGLVIRSAQPARAQGIVSPVPWCQVSAPVMPQFECISARAFLPIVEVKR